METQTQHLEKPPSLCSLGVRPITMTGFFVQLMRQHFANPQSIMEDAFRSRAWSEVACDGGISIIDGAAWDPANAGRQPEVVIKRNKWNPVKRSIGHFVGTTAEGHYAYSCGMNGSHTLFSTAKAGAEAEILGAEVYMFLLSMGPQLRADFNLTQFELAEVGEISILDKTPNVYAVPVSVVYAWEESWVLMQHAPILKRLTLTSLIPGAQ